MSELDDLEIHSEAIDDGVILRPVGEIDLHCAAMLRQQLSQAQGSPGRVVVDLTGVPYMDSSGVATLVEAMQVSRRTGGTLILCALQEKVRSIFEIARLDMVFTIVATTDEAVVI